MVSMKKIVLLLAFISACVFANAQEFKFGWKIGTSIGDNGGTGIRIEKGASARKEAFDLKLTRSKKDFSAGLWGSIKLQKFYILPELMLNTNQIQYSLVRPGITGVDTTKTDRFLKLDVPLMLGYRVGKAVFLKAGPSMHVNLSSKSDLTSVAGFTTKYNPVQFGYQFGVGIALGKKTQFDIRFNRIFDNYGDHIYVDNEQRVFPHKFRRLFFGLSFTL